MALASTFIDTTLIPQVLRYVFIYSIVDVFFHGPQAWNIAVGRDSARSVVWGLFIVSLAITLLGRLWLSFVTEYAPEPYLDEVFHIPQVQRTCQGDFTWDDKITTPPGLYVLSILFNRVSGLTCSVYHLRLFNVEMTAYVAAAAVLCRSWIEQPSTDVNNPRRFSIHAILTGFNVALFPVIFFFSGLYYTDVISTFVVLGAYVNQLRRLGQSRIRPLFDAYFTSSLGMLALVMRQTNIFWVVVFMGGLEVVHAIKSLRPQPVETPSSLTWAETLRFYGWRFSVGDIHDPPLNFVGLVDPILCIISIGIAAVFNLRTILPRIVPHLIILSAFIAFVAVNGGVVLGDKSNHVATIHFAQLLYIWPLFVFFSAPLFIPQVLHIAQSVYRSLRPSVMSSSTFPKQPRSSSSLDSHAGPEPAGGDHETPQQVAVPPMWTVVRLAGPIPILEALIVTTTALITAFGIVRFSTIIHPFTLADNRHYMFYVFRHSILRAWWVRYALAPVYVLCGWLCWTALRGYRYGSDSSPTRPEWVRSPFAKLAMASSAPLDAATAAGLRKHQQQPSLLPPASTTTITVTAAAMPPPTSTALILLLATALSLVTAPLVEPRYFILPWVFWRLHVPAWPVLPPSPSPSPSRPRWLGRGDGDPRLALELLWFAAVNAGTMYVFLAKPFYWRAEDGTLLDGGRVQRFMW